MTDLLNPISPKNPSNFLTQDSTSQRSEFFEGAEKIPLPSRGVFYGSKPEFRNIETLKLRPLNFMDEDVLTTPSYLKDYTVLNEILNSTIIDENGFNWKELVPIDRYTLLFWLRSQAFGPDYFVEFQCPVCKMKDEIHWDLSEFDFPQYKDEVYQELKENGEYEIVTPLKQLKVRIKVPSIYESELMEKEALDEKEKFRLKKTLYGTKTLLLIISGIVKENGTIIRNKNEIKNYLEQINLPISEARYIKSKLADINLKFETKVNFKCKNKECGHIEEGVEMPVLHPNFFWPES